MPKLGPVVEICDPSQMFRPESKYEDKTKCIEDTTSFRNFDDNARYESVRNTYHDMHVFQTVDFVKEKREKWGKLDHGEMTIMEALELLDNIQDDSDPDVDFPNSYHAYQTAESIRKDHPDEDWLHLTGLIHDIGKILVHWGEPQYCVVGDTFPVGCQHHPSIVFHEFFKENPDFRNPIYDSKYGMYSANCGFDNVLMSWGHDEYMYQVLKGNNVALPEESLFIVRYHSFYPWHGSGAYSHLADKKDKEMLKWVLEFNKYDLYSKSDDLPDIEDLIPYYESLVQKYCPGKLRW